MKLENRNIKTRFRYGLLIVAVIAAGILSRRIAFVPLITGDVLYAVMMFFMIKFLLIHAGKRKVAAISLSVCCLIELSQLYDAVWINQIRNTTLGGLVLGHGFLWSDILAYTAGTALCLLVLYAGKRRTGFKTDAPLR
jgi:hypothetical protein